MHIDVKTLYTTSSYHLISQSGNILWQLEKGICSFKWIGAKEEWLFSHKYWFIIHTWNDAEGRYSLTYNDFHAIFVNDQKKSYCTIVGFFNWMKIEKVRRITDFLIEGIGENAHVSDLGARAFVQ